MAVLRLLAALAAAAVLVSAGRPLKPAPGETAFCTLNAFGGNVTGTLTLTENSDGAWSPADPDAKLTLAPL